MNVAAPNKMQGIEIGASVLAPVAREEFYRAVLDVRGFALWAPGVRRVDVISAEGEAGMLSEWEVSLLGFGKKVASVLEEARGPSLLRWTYSGPVEGWGECEIREAGGGSVAAFRTAVEPVDPLLAGLLRSDAAKGAVRSHLRRSLARLGRLVSGGDAGVVVGPAPRAGRQGTEPATSATP